MAVIRLELAVDSEVYPELHAVLAAVGNSASRCERLRQLAATGLVWETVRIHGASLTRIQGTSHALNAEPPPVDGIDAPVGTKSGGPTAERRAPRPSDRSDFVDLALNAVPTAAPSRGDPLDSRMQGSDLDVPARHIPMLFDVINPPPGVRATAQPSTMPAEGVPTVTKLREASPPRTAGPPFADDIPDPPDSPLEDASGPAPGAGLAHKTAVRSRLLRMKEMGLFKNG